MLAARAAQVIGLDMTLPDITRSARETGGGVIEVNASPASACIWSPPRVSLATWPGL